eukprot:6212471-Pleurochrysis_carterae.AAC.6
MEALTSRKTWKCALPGPQVRGTGHSHRKDRGRTDPCQRHFAISRPLRSHILRATDTESPAA